MTSKANSKLSRVLAVGIGPEGRAALVGLRQRIGERYGDPDALPWLKLLSLNVGRPGPHPAGADQRSRLPPSSELSLGISEEQLRELRRSPEQFPHIVEWLGGGVPSAGAGGGFRSTRAYARLGFFNSYPALIEKLGQSVNSLTSRPIGGLDLGERRVNVGTDVVIYVVGSLAEQASGVFVDAACVIRHQLQLRNVDPTDVVGIFSLPPPDEVDESARADAYAALKELNHYLRGGAGFGARYGKFAAPLRTNQPPFRRCYLLAADGAAAADRLFFEITCEYGPAVRAAHGAALGAEKAPGKRAGYFCTFGIRGRVFMKGRLEEVLACRLAQAALRQWGGSGTGHAVAGVQRRLKEHEEEILRLPLSAAAEGFAPEAWLEQARRGREGTHLPEAVLKDVRARLGVGGGSNAAPDLDEGKLFDAVLSASKARVGGAEAPHVLRLLTDDGAASLAEPTLSQMRRATRPGLRLLRSRDREVPPELFVVGVSDLEQHRARLQRLLSGEGSANAPEVKWVETSDPHSVAFFREYVDLDPARIAGLEPLKVAYQKALFSGGRLLHSRTDVAWQPLEPEAENDAPLREPESYPFVAGLSVGGGL
ncbi:MAG TPA: tubulin-like doman-containing protein, partial [Pyrinomonadaceae bacterium]